MFTCLLYYYTNTILFQLLKYYQLCMRLSYYFLTYTLAILYMNGHVCHSNRQYLRIYDLQPRTTVFPETQFSIR